MAKDTKEHTCHRCGKTIKPGQSYIKEGNEYCCSTCCNRKDQPKNYCEFC